MMTTVLTTKKMKTKTQRQIWPRNGKDTYGMKVKKEHQTNIESLWKKESFQRVPEEH
jgi:hypothetical protein